MNVLPAVRCLLLPLLLAQTVVLSPGLLLAEEQRFTLSQVIAQALQHNGDLQALQAERGAREAARVRAGLLPNPTLDFEAGSGTWTDSEKEQSLAVGISQEFPLGGKLAKRSSVAERNLEVYRWQLADRERLLAEEVALAFHGALLAERRLALAERAIALNRQLLEVTRERLAAGDIPELEMNLAKVELARSEGSRIELAKNLLQSQARLWTLAGLPVGETAALVDTGEGGAAPVLPPLAELQQRSLEARPDLKALAAEKERDAAEVALARAEGVPNLTAGVVYRRDKTAMEIGGVEGRETATTLGIRLSIPLPVFDRNQAGIQEAGARLNSSENRWHAGRRNVAREVETAYAGYLHSEKVLALYRREIVAQLEENLQLTQEAYRVGEVGILAVLQEQKKFIEVSDGYLQALQERQVARVKLVAATATSLEGGTQ